MSSPFADIGKKSRDVLSKDFVEVDSKDETKYQRAAFEVKTKSLAGTGFAFTVSRKTVDPNYEASLAIKKSYKEQAIDTELSFSPKDVKLSISQDGRLVDGAKFGLNIDSNIGPSPQVGGSVTADYKKSGHVFNVKLGQDKKDASKFVTLAAATTRDRNVFGLSAKVNLPAVQLAEASLAAQHQGLDSQVSLALALKHEDADGEGETAKPERKSINGLVNVWHEYSATSQLGAEVKVPIRDAGDEGAVLRAALQHKLADDEILKARFEVGGANSRHLGLVYSTRFGAHTTVTASGDVDVASVLSKGLSTDHVRFGFKVSLNAE